MIRPDPYIREYISGEITYYYRKDFIYESEGELFESIKGPKRKDEELAYKVNIKTKVVTIILNDVYPIKSYDILNKTSLNIRGIYKKSGNFVVGFGGFLKQTLENIENLVYFAIDCNKDSTTRITGTKNKKFFLSLSDYDYLRSLYSISKSITSLRARSEAEEYLNKITKHNYFERNDRIEDLLPKATKKTIVNKYLETIEKKELFKLMFQMYDKAMELGIVDEIIFNKVDTYRLDWVINEYTKHLIDYSKNELQWQKFFEETFTTIYPNYKYIIREVDTIFGFEDIEAESRPVDFIAIDMYNNIELIELKTPSTQIISKVKNRNNYYLTSNCTRACTQLEKYLMMLEYNRTEIYKLIKKKIAKKYEVLQKDIHLTIIRPKAKLIMGMVNNFIDKNSIYSDFQMQRQSFKNIELITYDEILNGLEELRTELYKRKL